MAEMQLYSMVPLLQAAEMRSMKGYPTAIGAYNVNFYAQAEGILRGLERAGAPGIIQASSGANKFQGGPDKIQYIVLKAMENLGCTVPVCVHLDHGTEEAAKECTDKGFSSVMIDASGLPYDDNILKSMGIVKYAHKAGVSAEAEYGLLKGREDLIEHKESVYADPKKVVEFFIRSGVDALAIAYGTSHGPNKGDTAKLDVSIVAKSYAGLLNEGLNLDHFLVSHGSSTVPREYIDMINQYGGALKGSSGVRLDKIGMVIALGMRKVNIDTDLRLGMLAKLREWYSKYAESARSSPRVSLIADMLEGRVVAMDVKKNEPIPPAKISDPRNWLQELQRQNPESLREDYRDAKDDPVFIEVMSMMSDTVADHVCELSANVFAGRDLAAEVDKEMTLEAMARKYAA